MKSDLDWKMWRKKYLELSSRLGMTPNAFFDAVMVCIGAHAIYRTSRDRYLRYGYSEEQAEQRAKRRELGLAEDVLYNMGDGSETFRARQMRAVANSGTGEGGGRSTARLYGKHQGCHTVGYRGFKEEVCA